MANSDALFGEYEDITSDDTSLTNNEQNDGNSNIEIDCLSSQTSSFTEYDNISSQPLALITVKLGLLESKLNQTNNEVVETKLLLKETKQQLSEIEIMKTKRELETIKTNFAKQLVIKDNEIDRLNTKISEFERLVIEKLNYFDQFVDNTNFKFEKNETKLNIANTETENSIRAVKESSDETKTELKSTKDELNNNIVLKDNEINTKFSEFERSVTTTLSEINSLVHNSLSETELMATKTFVDNNVRTLQNQIAMNYTQFIQIQQTLETRLKELKQELAKVSDMLTESSPPATIAFFATSTPPTGWLKANGQHVSRTEYANLFAMIGTQYGCGDASTTFTLPDLRGEFIRAWSDGRDGVDTNRAFGSFQWGSSIPLAGNINEHNNRTMATAYQVYWSWAGKAFDNGLEVGIYPGETRDGITFSTENNGNCVAYGDLTQLGNVTSWSLLRGTRPRNIALLACIKY